MAVRMGDMIDNGKLGWFIAGAVIGASAALLLVRFNRTLLGRLAVLALHISWRKSRAGFRKT